MIIDHRQDMADYLELTIEQINVLDDGDFSLLESVDTGWCEDAHEIAEYDSYQATPTTLEERCFRAFFSEYEALISQTKYN